MFTKAHTLLSEDTWEKGPNIKNSVERTNKQKKETVLNPCLREDRAQAAKVVAARKNGSLSYRENSEEARGRQNDNRRRKQRFHAPKEDGREFSGN